jgi:hypothetical protein
MKYPAMTAAAAAVALSVPLSIGSAQARVATILQGGAAAVYLTHEAGRAAEAGFNRYYMAPKERQYQAGTSRWQATHRDWVGRHGTNR